MRNQEDLLSGLLYKSFYGKFMWKWFKKSDVLASLSLPLLLTVLNLWITPYISTAPRFFFYLDYKATELSFHLGYSIEHTIQFFNTIIWSENICKKSGTYFSPSQYLTSSLTYQTFFHSFCDILLGKPSATLLFWRVPVRAENEPD